MRPLLLQEVFLQTSALPLLSLLSLLAQSGSHAGYGHFAEVYSQLQPYKSERLLGLCLGISFCIIVHMRRVLVGNTAGQAEGHRVASGWPQTLGLVPSPRRGALRARSQTPTFYIASLGRGWPGSLVASGRLFACPERVAAGPGPAVVGEGRKPPGPRPRGQQMRGRCEVPRRGGKAAVGAGRPCDVNVWRPRPASRALLLCGASSVKGRRGGGYAAWSALIYTFPALPLSLLGPGKRVVTFAVNNEF